MDQAFYSATSAYINSCRFQKKAKHSRYHRIKQVMNEIKGNPPYSQIYKQLQLPKVGLFSDITSLAPAEDLPGHEFYDFYVLPLDITKPNFVLQFPLIGLPINLWSLIGDISDMLKFYEKHPIVKGNDHLIHVESFKFYLNSFYAIASLNGQNIGPSELFRESVLMDYSIFRCLQILKYLVGGEPAPLETLIDQLATFCQSPTGDPNICKIADGYKFHTFPERMQIETFMALILRESVNVLTDSKHIYFQLRDI